MGAGDKTPPGSTRIRDMAAQLAAGGLPPIGESMSMKKPPTPPTSVTLRQIRAALASTDTQNGEVPLHPSSIDAAGLAKLKAAKNSLAASPITRSLERGTTATIPAADFLATNGGADGPTSGYWGGGGGSPHSRASKGSVGDRASNAASSGGAEKDGTATGATNGKAGSVAVSDNEGNNLSRRGSNASALLDGLESPKPGNSLAGTEMSWPDDSGEVLSLKGRQDYSKQSYFQQAEETYQLQVALALRVMADAELAEEMEMASVPSEEEPVGFPGHLATPLFPRGQAEATAYRYWVNGGLSYEDRVEDGFYDLWGISPYVWSMCMDATQRGRMPPLESLRAMHPSEASFDVTLVNRTVDKELKELEDEAVGLAYAANDVQTLAKQLGALVAKYLGGAAGNETTELVPRYRQRGWELKGYLKTIVVPIGRLTLGLCRHRALLFKVLADALGMQCRITRGCKFCGMDDGASALVLTSDEREFAVDLISKPGDLYKFDQTKVSPGGIASPLRCPETKSLALGEGAQEGDNFWVPDFRRADSMLSDMEMAEFMLGSRRLAHMGSTAAAFGRSPLLRGRTSVGADLEPMELIEGEREGEGDDGSAAGNKKKLPPKARWMGAVQAALNQGNKAAVAAAAAEADEDTKGADLMPLLMSDNVMDVGEWEVPWEEIELGERVGAGSFGTVYRADWCNSDVAVKVLINQDLQEEQLQEFVREVAIMKRLRHPNVVLFMGAVTKPPNLSIVSEFLARGSLFRLLHRPGAKEQLNEGRRMRMAMDVAKGINYLHRCTPMIVHRDLKSPNLLVDKNWTVKVCDFGLSRSKNSTFLSSKSGAGTPEWMAPEVLRNEPSDEKSDVYSFGVILWEIATLKQPWDGMNPMQVVGAVGFQRQRLSIEEGSMDPALADLIRSCWEDDPKKRPKFPEIMAVLKPLLKGPAAGKGLDL